MAEPSLPKILVVDDRPANLQAMQRLFAVAGVQAEVWLASSGNEALKLVLEHEFAVMLLDVDMPDMDGYEVAELLKSVENTKHQPIIFITAAYKDQTHQLQGYAAGAVDYLEKPVDDAVLLGKVGVFLELHNSRKALEATVLELASTNHRLQTEMEQRGRVETALHERETMYSSLVTAMGEGVVFQDANGIITAVNPAAERIEGRPAEQMLGKTPDDTGWGVVHEDGTPLPGGQHPAMTTLRSGEPQTDVVMGIHRPDGALRWISVNSQPLIAAGATKPYAVVSTFHDITERRRMEAALRESERRFRGLVENWPDEIVRYDRDCRRVYVNPYMAATQALGQPLLGLTPMETYPESKEIAFYESKLREALTTGAILNFEMGWETPSARPTYRLLRVVPEQDDNGIIQGAFAIARDITELKLAQEALERERSFLKTLLQTLPDLVWLKNPEGVYLACNRRFEQFFGTGEAAILGKTDYDFVDRNLADFFRDKDRAAMAAGHALTNEEEVVFVGDGQRKTLETIKTPMFDGQGRLVGVLGIARDITWRKQVEQARVEAQEALKRLNQTLEQRIREEVAKNREKDHLLIQQSRLAAMGEMVHNIAHQWRQPLNALAIVIHNIKDDYDYGELTAESLQEAVDKSHRLLQRMSATVDDFRDFFRSDKDAQEFKLDGPVEDALFIIGDSLRNNGIAVESRLEKGLCAHGYPNQFAQAILNLLANAKEAILERRTTGGQIAIALQRHGKEAVLTVQDNAGGIDGAALPKVFDPYFTTKDQGSGIGLYMTRMIIERNLKGRIEATNRNGGALFTVTIPLADQ